MDYRLVPFFVMGLMTMDLKLTESQIEDIIDYFGRNLVGKIMRKFEVVQDIHTLKSLVKDTIWEELRHERDILVSVGAGGNLKTVRFISKGKQDGK